MTGILVSFRSYVSSNFFNSYTFKREGLVCSGGLVISFCIFSHLPTYRNNESTNVTLFFSKVMLLPFIILREAILSSIFFLAFYKVPYAQEENASRLQQATSRFSCRA